MSARIETGMRLALGAIFLWAGVTKIAHPADFFSDLLAYEVPLSESFLRLTAVTLPWLEALCGIALLLNFWAETIRPMVAALCAIFVLMLGQAVVRGLDLNCGCFGATAVGWIERPDIALTRALLFLAASLFLVIHPTRRFT